MDLEILTPETAPAESRPLSTASRPIWASSRTWPQRLRRARRWLSAFDGMRRAVGGESFNPVHREIAGLAVGVAVDNGYGVAFHSAMLSRLGVVDEEIEAMRAGDEPADPTQAAVYAFAGRSRSIAVRWTTR